MTDQNTGSSEAVAEAPEAVAEVTAPATPPADELTRLRSAQAGSDRQVTSLQQQLSDAAAARDKAIAERDALASGKGDADAALKERADQFERELIETRAEAKAAKLAQAYPETVKLFGAAVVDMAADVLEASEARLVGVPATVETKVPTPVGNNASREPAKAVDLENMSTQQIREFMLQEFRGRDAQGNPI